MFGSKEAFGINISDYSLEALELTREKGIFVTKAYSRLLLESGVVENGKIIEREKFKGAVKRLLSQAKPTPIAIREVVLTVPESRVFVQTFTLPRSLHKKQVPAALLSKAKETIPLDSSLITADFREIGKGGDVA